MVNPILKLKKKKINIGTLQQKKKRQGKHFEHGNKNLLDSSSIALYYFTTMWPNVVHAKNFLGRVTKANHLHVAASWATLRYKEFGWLVEGMVHLNFVFTESLNGGLFTQTTAAIFKGCEDSCGHIVIVHFNFAVVVQTLGQEFAGLDGNRRKLRLSLKGRGLFKSEN